MSSSEWQDHAEIVCLRFDEDWSAFTARFDANSGDPALHRVIDVVRQNGAVSVLVEHQYVCRDYRSEYIGFYGSTFRRVSSRSTRLHFFDQEVTGTEVELGTLPQLAYLGYSVIRPLTWAPVGRTVIRPPRVTSGRMCVISDPVDVFGTPLIASGVPFMSQDGSYLRCAHAAQWMVLYHAFRRGVVERPTPSLVQQAGMGGEVVGRQVPSSGLSPAQLLHSLHELGLSPGREPLPGTQDESQRSSRSSLPAVLCRYVNSQMPPIVMSRSHVWVVVGYTVDRENWKHDAIRFFRHDDELGPYLPVLNPWQEDVPAHREWLAAFPPLPRKCYLAADRAEILGEHMLSSMGSGALSSDATRRTYAIRSSEFKHGLRSRGIPADVAAAYRLESWPSWIWVVEAVDRQLRSQGDPDVIGEAIFDATSPESSEDPQTALRDNGPLLALHTDGVALLAGSATPRHRILEVEQATPYLTGMPAPPS